MKPAAFSVVRAVIGRTSLTIMTLLVMCVAAQTQADDYPARPIRLIVPFAAGGPNDIIARIMATELGKSLGQNIITENRPGASGNIAAELAARDARDGYTLFWAQGATHGANPWLYGAEIKYDPVKDFVPIALIGRAHIVVLTAPGSGIKSLDDLLRKAKAAPGKLTFASGGHGTSPHMAGELLKASAGIKLVHIPYKGSQPAIVDAIAGEVDIVFDGVASAIGYIKSGQLMPLAVSANERLPALPEVPAISEVIPGFDVAGWSGIAAPAGTPVAVVKRLNQEINRALKSSAVSERFAQLNVLALGGSPADMQVHVKSELEKWKKVVADNGIKAD